MLVLWFCLYLYVCYFMWGWENCFSFVVNYFMFSCFFSVLLFVKIVFLKSEVYLFGNKDFIFKYYSEYYIFFWKKIFFIFIILKYY